jgi:glyoxylase-like metal-dependent hydrolase (beta-lactamase superfamily II)
MDMVIQQLAVGGFDANFSYLLHDPATGEAVLIDPCGDPAILRRAIQGIRRLHPRHVLLTHGHRDHRDALDALGEIFPAPLAAHPDCPACPELPLAHGQRLPLGGTWIECLHTPGHSPDSVVYRLGDQAIFTGDTLFVDCCGYCTADIMFRTLREVIRPLPDGLEVYPGHDYGHLPHASLGDQKRDNPYLAAATLAEFRERLKEL